VLSSVERRSTSVHGLQTGLDRMQAGYDCWLTHVVFVVILRCLGTICTLITWHIWAQKLLVMSLPASLTW
jgi:hypothetical protein